MTLRRGLFVRLVIWMRCLIIAAVVVAAGGALAAEPAAPVNSARLRPLEFDPFAPALAALPPGELAHVDGLVRGARLGDLQAAMNAGELTSETLTLYFISRIRTYDDRLRAFIELNPKALDDARAADRQRAAGNTTSALLGIPVALKDNIETSGPMHTTAGAELLVDHVAPADAPLVKNLRDAGAVILGKTNLSEFAGAISFGTPLGGASAVGGQTVNPYGAFPVGGSSSGSAVATTSLLTAVSVGTETSGSIIAPSAWNGVVGMKPSRDVIDATGVVPLVANNDSPGPIARSVSDVATLLGVLDRNHGDYASALRIDALDGITVGMLMSDIVQMDGNTALFQGVAATLTAIGARLRPAEIPVEAGFAQSFNRLLAAGIRYDLMGYVGKLRPAVQTPEALAAYNQADAARRIPAGQLLLETFAPQSSGISVDDYQASAAHLREAASHALDAAFARIGADVLVSVENEHSSIYSTAGYPAITVPIGLRTSGGIGATLRIPVNGMPTGVTLIGKPGRDRDLIAYAYAFEQASRLRVATRLQ